MTCKDRTQEFGSIVKSLQSNALPSKPHPPARSSEFMVKARQIGYEINLTLAKLEQLTELAKGRSLFGDPAAEIQRLTQVIKDDIAKLNSDIAGLQQVSRAHSRGGKHLKSHSGVVVISLQTKLADLSQGFKGVLERRTENLKVQQQRREQFSSTPLPPMFKQANGDTTLLVGGGGSLLLGTASPDVSIDMDSVQNDRRNQMQLLQEQDTYIQERADTMENIHSTIVELGQIFRQLATMVKEQEEQVMRVDANVTETQLNVEAGYGELLKYFKGVTSNRWLMVKIFAVVIIFFIIFIVFLA